jgi:hypothetical protein
MRRSAPDAPGLAAAFFTEIFCTLNAAWQHQPEQEPDAMCHQQQEPEPDGTGGSAGGGGGRGDVAVVTMGVLCSSSGTLTDAVATCHQQQGLGEGQGGGEQLVTTSAGIRCLFTTAVPNISYYSSSHLYVIFRNT